MSRTEYRFDGLDAQEQQLSRMIEEEYPAEFRAMVIQIARELQGKVKEKTPHKTGRLQDSWKVGPIVKKGDTYYIRVGLFAGNGTTADGQPNYMWASPLTREQAAQLFYRFAQDHGLA